MLFKDVATKIADRPGGYTRILKTGGRLGDNADMCFIELVDFNENMLSTKAPVKVKAARRGAKKKATDTAAKATKGDSTAANDAAGEEAKGE